MNKKGFSIIETLIIVTMIGLIIAVAIPSITHWIEETKLRVCIENLHTIDNAKAQWAVTENEPDDAEPTTEDLEDYVKGDVPAQCVVAGALYKIGDVVTPALCSYHGNRYIQGLRMTVPNAIVKLVEKGELTVANIVKDNWLWYSGVFQIYDSEKKIAKSTQVDKSITPEVNVNGKTFKSDAIVSYSKEYIQKNKDYFEASKNKLLTNATPTRSKKGPWLYGIEGYDHLYLSEMDNGGYGVAKSNIFKDGKEGDTCEYYDSNGSLIGYRFTTYEPDSTHYYYDTKGNLLISRKVTR